MKPEELSIGDWVDINCFDQTTIRVKVSSITETLLYFLSKDNSSHWCSIENIEPIPLTPEILEKNGFELKPDGWIWSIEKEIEEENYIFIQFRKGCDEVRLCEINFVNKVMANFRKINYVHELQHVLRLCGIDKEIII